MTGFEGDHCDRCAPGFYNFPNCRPCNCDPAGTVPGECDVQDAGKSCRCDQSGTCACKARVEGKKCASCRPGNFGLTKDNPEGCISCFCFGRSRSCQQADFVWTQVCTKYKPIFVFFVLSRLFLCANEVKLSSKFRKTQLYEFS